MSDFSIETSLLFPTSDLLTPLGIRDHNAKESSAAANQWVWFDLKVKDKKIDRLEVKIRDSKRTIYEGELEKYMCNPGHYQWKWDGFDSLGKFDSKALKLETIKAEFTGHLGKDKKSAAVNFRLEAARVDWTDVIIDKKAKTAEIRLRLNLKDGGQDGVGEGPPKEVQNASFFRNIPQNDSRRKPHLRLKSHADLQVMAGSGMEQYWSRAITAPDNSQYQAKTRVDFTAQNAMDDLDLVYNTNREWLRSSNPGQVRGIYSLFGNFVPERIAYNAGWIGYSNGWGYVTSHEADMEFKETAAHEIGHEILSAYGGDTYSYSHRGSSSVATQSTKAVNDGGFEYPQSGAIDLMKYYNGSRPRDYFVRVYASEADVASLLWLNGMRIIKK